MLKQPDIQERLRDACFKLRTTPVLLADLIPLLQQAADKIDQLEDKLDNTYREMSFMEYTRNDNY